MKINNENHHEYMRAFCIAMAKRLIDALEESGVKKPEKQEKIITSFLFSFCTLNEQYYVKDNNGEREDKLYPFVAFRSAIEFKESDMLLIPTDEDDYHGFIPFEVGQGFFNGEGKENFDVICDNGLNGDVPIKDAM